MVRLEAIVQTFLYAMHSLYHILFDILCNPQTSNLHVIDAVLTTRTLRACKDLLESLLHLEFGQLFVYTSFYASKHQVENGDSGPASARSLLQPDAFILH